MLPDGDGLGGRDGAHAFVPTRKRGTTVPRGACLMGNLCGIASLAVSRKLAQTESPEDMVASLAANYIAGLRMGCTA